MKQKFQQDERLVQRIMQLIVQTLEMCEPKDFAIELWNGMRWEPASERTRVTLVIRDPGAIRTLLFAGSSLALAELYMKGSVDIFGDIEALLPLADYLLTLKLGLIDKLTITTKALLLPRCQSYPIARQPAVLSGKRGSRKRSRVAIQYHYDLPSKFWKLWLDPYMQYTCAYFRNSNDNLETAQAQKLEYICRKLRLKPGERLLDLGCGFGGLLIYAAKQYQVQSIGLTLSKCQVEYARDWIKREGLETSCQVELCDFRDAPDLGMFDKVTGIGILEHLGTYLKDEYFRTAYNCLRPGGVLLNQASGYSSTRSFGSGKSFMQRYIFPDTQLLHINQVLAAAENMGFEVRDVENLREHYQLTLKHWLERFESNAEVIQNLIDNSTYRAFQLYLAGSKYSFSMAHMTLYQSVFAKLKNGYSHMPLTRVYL